VSDLGTALSNVNSSFQALSENERTALISSQTRLAMQDGNQIVIRSECSDVRRGHKVDCIPQLRAGRTTSRFVYQSATPNALKLAGAVASYGDSLITLTQAKDVSDLKDAIGKSGAAIDKLAASVGAPAEPLGTLSSVVGWAIGQYLDELRFEQLRGVVNRADPIIANAASLLSSEARVLKQTIIVQRSALLSQENENLVHLRKTTGADFSAIEKLSDSVVADAVALQEFANTDVTAPFISMRTAHAALRASLNDPKIPPDVAFSKIGEFLDQLSKLNKVLDHSKGGA